MEKIKEAGSRVALAFSTALFMVVGTVGIASAQTADPVSDAFADMKTKVLLYGGLIVTLVVAAVGIFLGIKYLRKGVSKA